MLKFILLSLCLVIGVSCASYRENKEVKKDAAAVTPTTNPQVQYGRAVSMVQASPDLTPEQKEKLVTLINDYSRKMIVNKEKQGQYRTALLDVMLENDKKSLAKISAAKKDLTNLNKQSSGYLESFVAEFKSIIGKTARNHEPELLEVISVE